MDKKVKIARLSIFSNCLLIVLKLAAGLISGSVSIISEAIHSTMDLLASIIAFFSVKVSAKKPDFDHPYGHGKFENVSGVLEALLIFVAAGLIIFESVKKIIAPAPMDSIGIGFAVMIISAGVNFFVSRKLYKVAKETDSIALEADALHLKTDVITSLGVGLGLLLIWVTGLKFLDPFVAITVALFILYESWHLFRNAFKPLLDNSLPKEDIQLIVACFEKHNQPFHKLRTRKAGGHKFVDLHMEVDGNLSVAAAHKLCDNYEDELQKLIGDVEVTIHVETIDSVSPEVREALRVTI